MAALQETNIVCKDCEKSFLFTAAEAKEFTEKGYANLPLRCAECREKRRNDYHPRRRAPRAKRPAGEKPAIIPPAASVVADGATVMRNGTIALVRRGYGFITYDEGRVYFPVAAFTADKATLRVGTYVDFVCERDAQDRITAKTVNAAANPPAEAAPRAPRAPRASRNGASSSADADAAAAPRPPRVMINITVECAGKPTKVVQKPAERATFTVFRKLISREHKGELGTNFQLYRGEDLLSYEAFNQLKEGDVVNVREIERPAPAAAAEA